MRTWCDVTLSATWTVRRSRSVAYSQNSCAAWPSNATRRRPFGVDTESGDVLVNGDPVEPLSNLEYKLILLLFENVDRIVDKYQIVTGVWGEHYLDEVDDARVEKLISRLRQKIEPDASEPQFVTTVRGRGYRLASGCCDDAVNDCLRIRYSSSTSCESINASNSSF